MDYTEALNTVASSVQFALIILGAVSGAQLVKALW